MGEYSAEEERDLYNGTISRPPNNIDVISFRLDTTSLINDIIYDIMGYQKKEVVDQQNNRYSAYYKSSMSKMNAEGIGFVRSWLNGLLNHHMSQANFHIDAGGFSDEYEDVIEGSSKDFLSILYVNLGQFGIYDPADANALSQQIYWPVKTFLTRAKGDKERQSLNTVAKVVSTSSSVSRPFQENKGLLGGIMKS